MDRVGPARRRGTRRAFTIFELMNLLAVIGLLSGIAMYSLARYVRHSKTAEAIGSLNALGKASVAYFDASDSTQPVGTTPDAAHAMRHFPSSSTKSVPPSLDDIHGKRYQSSPVDWTLSPWHELQFTIPQPQCYAYSYLSEGAGSTAKATAIAKGDLDADDNVAIYSVTVTPDPSFAAQVGPLVKEDPDE
jgi:Tfp pilus assembly protein PilE